MTSGRRSSDSNGNGIEDEDEDYDLDEQGMDGESGVQLGTVVPFEGPTGELLFKNIDWHGWDGGKAGGWPVWLNPRDLPAPDAMRCGECNHALSFLVQLYCPLDHEDDTFHRCLYVFCCPKASCSKNLSVKALRCQLPRDNDFYPYEPDKAEEPTGTANSQERSVAMKRRAGADPSAWGVTLCCVCGQLAKSACSKCRRARYCGREHQTQHWKNGHKKACGSPAGEDNGPTQLSPGTTPFVFREFEVEVRPEPPPPLVAPDGRTAEETLAAQLDLGKADIGNNEEDEDSKLSQAELDNIAGVHGVKDKVTLKFLTRTQANPQVVRYDAVDAGPLWSSSNGMPGEADVPPCSRCGRARKFEFQVMPHLLHHLGIEADSKVWNPKAASPGALSTPPNAGDSMDWGTLAVYTCPASCPIGVDRNAGASGSTGGHGESDGARMVASYVEEFVWRQPPP